MIINEKRLRQLIREAIKKEPLFDPVIKSELDDAMLRSRETAIVEELKQYSNYTEEEARKIAQKLIVLYDSNNQASMTQARTLADTFDINPDLLDMKYYQGDRKKFLSGQYDHATSVAVDQLRANLTDPNANFGNPQIGNPELASDETRGSKWWKDNVLNKPTVLADLEIIPFEADRNYPSAGILVASSHKDVIENLIKNMLAHRRVGDSASYIKMDNRDFQGLGQIRKLGDMHNTIEYATADPFQAYRISGDGPHYTDDVKSMIRGDHVNYRRNITPSGVNIGDKFFVIIEFDGNMSHSPMAYDSVAPWGTQNYDAPKGPFHGYQSKTAGAPPKRKYEKIR